MTLDRHKKIDTFSILRGPQGETAFHVEVRHFCASIGARVFWLRIFGVGFWLYYGRKARARFSIRNGYECRFQWLKKV